MKKDLSFIFSPEKNAILKAERGISFEDIIFCIQNDEVLDVIPHHNPKKYPDQNIMIVEMDQYAYLVPFKHEDEHIILITAFPSRKFTKKYIGGKDDDQTTQNSAFSPVGRL